MSKKEDKILKIGYGSTHHLTFADQIAQFKVAKNLSCIN